MTTRLRMASPDDVSVMRSTQFKQMLGVHTGLAAAQTTPFDILAGPGTSLMAGTNSVNSRYMWIYRLLHNLRERFPVPGVVGGAGWQPGYDPMVGPIGSGVTQVLTGLGNSGSQLGSGATLNWYNRYCTSFTLRFRGAAAGDAVTVQIDGGAAVPVTIGSGDFSWSSGALTAGNHNVTVTQTSGSPILKASGWWNGDETTGIRLTHTSKPGSKTGDWQTSLGGNQTWLTEAAAVCPTPGLIVLDQFANDAPTYTSAAYYANYSSLIGLIRAQWPTTPIVIVGMYRRVTATPAPVEPWANYVAVERRIAHETTFCSLLNVDDLIDITTPFNFMRADTYHPGPEGQQVLADLVTEFVVPASGPSGDQRLRQVRGALQVFGLDNVVSALVRPGGGQTADILHVEDAPGANTWLKVDVFGKTTVSNLFAAGQLNVDGAAGTLRSVVWSTGGVSRAIMRLDNSAESGSNAGSNLSLLTYTDRGAALATAFSVVRSTGQVQIPSLKVSAIDGSSSTLVVSANAGVLRNIQYATGNSTRWLLGADNSSESGSDAGSNFALSSRTDAGAAKTTIFAVTRSNGRFTWGDGVDHAYGTTSGTRHGTQATQKQAFYGATPIVQPSGTPAAATDAASTQTLANSLRASLIALGLIA